MEKPKKKRNRKPHKESTKALISESNSKVWSDREFLDNFSKKMKMIMSSRVITEEEHKRRSDAAKKRGETPNATLALKAYWKDPDNREQKSKQMSAMFEDPEKRLKVSKKSKEVMNTPEVKKKCSDSAKRRLERPEEMERLIRQAPVAARILALTSPTSIERTVMSVLEELQIDYEFQVQIGPFVADFVVGYLVIEADGEPWHKNKSVERRRDGYLKKAGFQVLHLSDKIIETDCRLHILAALGK